MKKIIVLLIISIFLTTSIQIPSADKTLDVDKYGTYVEETFLIKFPDKNEIKISKENDYHAISIDGLLLSSSPGEPRIPYKNIKYLLPKDASKIQVSFDADFQKLPHSYNIANCGQIQSYNVEDEEMNNNLNKNMKQRYEEIYSNDACYPQNIGKIKDHGFYYDYDYVIISLSPFQYKPISQSLSYATQIKITIQYQLGENQNQGMIFSDEKKQENNHLFYNSERIKQNKQQTAQNTIIHDYILITSDELKESITKSDFIDWKNSLGHSINIITLSDEMITNQEGRDLAEQIRNFLREIYLEWDVSYVLFVGDYATVPMRYCYPDPTNHRFEPFDISSGEVPTDYYYADLSRSDEESWDSDGDGFYGEYKEDEPDFLTEISVGRIPINEPSKITYTLNKIVRFEKDTGGWKNNALNAGAFFYFENEDRIYTSMDGAVLSHHIEQDIMNEWKVSKYSEQEGLEKSIYPWSSLSEESFISDWRNGEYAIVNWQGHGWTTGVARKVWVSDDGDEIPEANEIQWPFFITGNSDLDDNYPSIVTAVSCYVGCPEPDVNGNLGIDLLTDPNLGAAVAVVASARSPYGSENWPTDIGGSDSIIYEFNKNIIKESMPLGNALYTAKFYCNQEYGWDNYVEYIDVYTFNLYGDPSMLLEGASNNRPPSTPVINGPYEGNKNEECSYDVTSSDLDNHQISYLFDWGDGTESEWTGPYSSGETCTMTHSWNTKDNYVIKVKAQDDQGATSDWATLQISISKQKRGIISFLQFIRSFLNESHFQSIFVNSSIWVNA